jgi:hypothetical protein
MKPPLRPCPSCSRHLRAVETTCPFCGHALPVGFADVPQPVFPKTRLTRAAIFALGAALGSAPACDGDLPTVDGAADGSGRDGSKGGSDGGGSGGAGGDAGPSDGGGSGGTASTDAAGDSASQDGSPADGNSGLDRGIAVMYGAPPPG